MNRSFLSILAVIGVLMALAAILTALYLTFRPNIPTQEDRRAELIESREADETALLLHMIQYQRYASKAQRAAEEGNWPLATFYAEKVERNTLRLIEGGYILNEMDISAIASEIALPASEHLVQTAHSNDPAAFSEAVETMYRTCNACHIRSGNPFVQVVPTTGDEYSNQRFELIE